MIFRSERQKQDLEGSFKRPDRPFFAAGACHVLAHAFLETIDSDDWWAQIIYPDSDQPGFHVFATDGKTIFDYHGLTDRGTYIEHYFTKMQRFFPGWRGSIIDLTVSPISPEFCVPHGHRQPHQYYSDPLPRAFAFASRHLQPPPNEQLERSH